jgi:hypothetical protein
MTKVFGTFNGEPFNEEIFQRKPVRYAYSRASTGWIAVVKFCTLEHRAGTGKLLLFEEPYDAGSRGGGLCPVRKAGAERALVDC